MVGLVASIVGGIWLFIAAFRVSLAWGFGILVPFVILFFVFKHWDKAARPFGICVGGDAVMIIGFALGGQGS
jgi:hypothetical protein